MLRPANSIYIPHFAVWPAKRSVLERAVCRLAACSGNNSMQDEFWHAACDHSWWFRHQSSAGCAFTLVKRGGNHKPLACKYKNKKVLQYFTVQLWKSGESIHNLLIRTYIFLVYTKTVDSVFRALWLATQSVNILHYSLIHLQFLRASDAKTRVSCDQNAFPVCCRKKQRHFTTNKASCSRNTRRRWRSSVWKF